MTTATLSSELARDIAHMCALLAKLEKAKGPAAEATRRHLVDVLAVLAETYPGSVPSGIPGVTS